MALLPFVDDPAKVASLKLKEELGKLTRPLPDDLIPKELDEVARQNAVAQAAWKAAEREIDRLQVQNAARAERIALLETLIAKAEEVRHVWCVTYSTGLTGEVDTLELPGFWQDEGEAQLVTLFEGTAQQRNVVYAEYAWNIAPSGHISTIPVGQMQYADGLSDAGVYYNAAMEPGHLRWKPRWRYARLLQDADSFTNSCSLQLDEALARTLRREPRMDINQGLMASPIDYPCGGRVFFKDDDVVVVFLEGRWEAPVVVGFRRKPRKCPRTWNQLG